MKKKVLLASMMVMAAVSLAGCSGKSANKATASSVTTDSSTAESSDTESSANDSKKTSDSKDAQKDTQESKTSAAKDTAADEPADPDADSSASDIASVDDTLSYAAAFIGVSMDEFKSTFGQPTSSSVSTNEAGEELRTYTYDNFTVTTHKDSDGTEVIDDVE